ncbi:MAG: hypothetical protein IKF52_00605 [Clostridia bacterium]|nr:hypothetical protein [Clostridia bacterium]
METNGLIKTCIIIIITMLVTMYIIVMLIVNDKDEKIIKKKVPERLCYVIICILTSMTIGLFFLKFYVLGVISTIGLIFALIKYFK